MANNLKDHLKEVADAIRAKKGTTDLINPQDFATEIEGISGGGSGSGEPMSSWRYFDVSNMIADKTMLVQLFLPYLVNRSKRIEPAITDTNMTNVTAVAVDGEALFSVGENGQLLTWSEVLALEGLSPESLAQVGITEITKEQFYDLNA